MMDIGQLHADCHDHSVVVACRLPPLPSTASTLKGVVRAGSSTAEKMSMSGVAEKKFIMLGCSN